MKITVLFFGITTDLVESSTLNLDLIEASTKTSSDAIPTTPQQSTSIPRLLSPNGEEDEEEEAQKPAEALEEANDANDVGGYQTFTISTCPPIQKKSRKTIDKHHKRTFWEETKKKEMIKIWNL